MRSPVAVLRFSCRAFGKEPPPLSAIPPGESQYSWPGCARATGLSMKLPSGLDPTVMLLAFGVSAAIGLFFGFYPARKASRLRPVEALRTD